MRLTLAALVALPLCAAIASATVRRVPQSYPTIQQGLDAAEPGDSVIVRVGTYSGPGNRDLDFLGKPVTLMAEPGHLAPVIMDCEGSQADPHRGFLLHSNEGPSTRIIGLTIQHAYDAGEFNSGGGGGMRLVGASPTVVDCSFLDDGAYWVGGAVAAYGGGPVFTRCWFHGCTLIAIHLDGTSAVFNGCTFAQNDGGVHTWGSNPSFSNCTFFDNGGATIIYVDGGSHVSVSNTIVAFNHTWYGHPLDRNTGDMALSCCDVYGNENGDWAGFIADQFGTNGNISSDPRFCDSTHDLLRLDAESPCAPHSRQNPGCDLVGAWPVGCGSLPQIGACCLSGYCAPLSPEECAGYGGGYQGDGTSCDPNPCPTSSIDSGDRFATEVSASPNPSSGPVTFHYLLPIAAASTVSILDASGRVVRRFAEGARPAGAHSTTWDGRDASGREVASGVYVYRIASAGGSVVGQVIIAR